MNPSDQIIVIKKKKAHHGHHGGAWKVAYADFVTAMMALFIVLWLLNTSKPTQQAVGGYFRDPKGTADKNGLKMLEVGGAVKKDEMSKLKEKLMNTLTEMVGFEKMKNQIEMTITTEGLKIELMEAPNGTFFENGKAAPTAALAALLTAISGDISKIPNPLLIEGHTDANPYAPGTYGNWELSTDRANMARRLMEDHGVRQDQVLEVRGFADRELRNPEQPQASANRRVTLLIRYAPHEGPEPALVYKGDTPVTKADVSAAEQKTKAADKPSAALKK